jgi:hypothetical protein
MTRHSAGKIALSNLTILSKKNLHHILMKIIKNNKTQPTVLLVCQTFPPKN